MNNPESGPSQEEESRDIESEVQGFRDKFFELLKNPKITPEKIDEVRIEHMNDIVRLTDLGALRKSHQISWGDLQRAISITIATTLQPSMVEMRKYYVDNFLDYLEKTVPNSEREDEWYINYLSNWQDMIATERERVGIPK